MPSKTQEKSEYQTKFPWRDSKLSVKYKPSPEEEADTAGMTSTKMYNVMEPPIQRKKKPVNLSSEGKVLGSSPSKGSMDDYFLLGNQKKFGPSIKYRNMAKYEKQRKNARKQEEIQEQPKEKTYSPGPAPKVVVNTGAPARKQEKTATKSTSTSDQQIQAVQQGEKRNSAVQVGGPTISKTVDDQDVETPVKTPKAPRKEKSHKEPVVNGYISNERVTQYKKPKSGILKENQSKTNKPSASQSAPEVRGKYQEDGVKDKLQHSKDHYNKKDQPPEKPKHSKGLPDKREQRKGQMNEFAQTNLEKGVADSAPEASANYAMKYKAGIPPPRPKSSKRLSEYQLQYKWRDSVPSAPLIAAEQMVYNSNPQVAPYKPDRVPKTTEYQAQFMSWDKVNQAKLQPSAKPQLVRSASAESITNEVKADSRSKPVVDKRMVKSSVNPQKLHFPHGKLKSSLSEYQCNYKEPSKFAYEKGAWKGADPPHVLPAKQDDPPAEEAPSTKSSWFQEVMELRQRAAEYKRRAHGTHFSKEHLVQLYHKQADLWDMVSNRSTLSALSLERTEPKENDAETAGSSVTASVPSAREAWTQDDQDASDTLSALSSRPVSSSSVVSEEQNGRLPTPTLRSAASSHRHHLDRTTPVIGGNLLASPPQNKTKPAKPKTKGNKRGQETDSSGGSTPVASTPVNKVQESSSAPAVLTQNKTTPTFGMPTRDSHVLMDDEASQDRPLDTEYVYTPVKQRVKPAGIPTTIPEATEPFTIPKAWLGTYSGVKNVARRDDDILSTSARSLASSASLASETLRRAAKHRQEFWGKN